jgi:iron(III) transport system substrate-binding protein
MTMTILRCRGLLRGLLAAATAILVLEIAPVQAQTQPAAAPAGKNDALFMYRGADRDKVLLEKAKQEGSVMVYTSFAALESSILAKAFEKKYGIKVELWRGLSDKVLQRTVTEGRAHRAAVDVIETNSPEMEMMTRENLLSKFYSPYIADLPPNASAPDRFWVTERVAIFVVAFNTNKYKRADMPKNYEDFLDPKWKGQIGLEATDSEWMATVIKKMGIEKGTAFFQKLAAMNPDVRTGHSLLTEMVAAGEVPVALTTYNANDESLKLRGGPIDWIPVEPVVGRPQGLGIAKAAPHPHAALLFADFVLSPEGQQLFATMGVVPSSLKIKSNLNNFPYASIDPITALDESEKWQAMWDKLFVKK